MSPPTPLRPFLRASVFAALLTCALATSGLARGIATARKPPLSLGVPAQIARYWDVRVRWERAAVRIVSVTRGRAPAGKKVRIQAHVGPMRIVLLGAKDRVFARRSFAFPLLGSADDDPLLGAGLTAEVDVRLAHVPGLRGLRIEDSAGNKVAGALVRWPGEPADVAPPAGSSEAEVDAAAQAETKREPRELLPIKESR